MNIDVRGVMTLLQVFDMPTSVRFYRDVLGFEVVRTTTPREGDQFDWGLLRLNDTELMLNTAYEQDDRPDAMDPARIKAHRDMCLYFSCPDVDGAIVIFRRKESRQRSRRSRHGVRSNVTYAIRMVTRCAFSGRLRTSKLMVPISILDLVPVILGETPREALRKSLELAQHAERVWL